MKDILVIEPFNGGSHGQLLHLLATDTVIGNRCEVYSLPAKKWHWRARTSALYFSQTIGDCSNYRFLFTSSVLNLAELVALRPALTSLKKIVYFHENQLVYPVRKKLDRDFQYGYNQILTSLVADCVIFNSNFNMESFLPSISSHLKLIPDHRPKNIDTLIRSKCRVVPFPIVLQQTDRSKQSSLHVAQESVMPQPNDQDSCEINKVCEQNQAGSVVSQLQEDIGSNDSGSLDDPSSMLQKSYTQMDETDENVVKQNIEEGSPELTSHITLQKSSCLHIVWPHRWEHDKDPDSFFTALFQLAEDGFDFVVSVIGESFSEVPDVFASAKEKLGERVYAWGFQSKQDYWDILDAGNVVVSTAQHEFFGVSMLEAVSRGCYPLCPRRLVYPEIYPEECLYSTQAQLVKRLKRFCKHPSLASGDKFKAVIQQYSWENLKDSYRNLFQV